MEFQKLFLLMQATQSSHTHTLKILLAQRSDWSREPQSAWHYHPPPSLRATNKARRRRIPDLRLLCLGVEKVLTFKVGSQVQTIPARDQRPKAMRDHLLFTHLTALEICYRVPRSRLQYLMTSTSVVISFIITVFFFTVLLLLISLIFFDFVIPFPL